MFEIIGIIIGVLALVAGGGALIAWILALILRIWKVQPETRTKVFYTAWILSSLGVLAAVMAQSE